MGLTHADVAMLNRSMEGLGQTFMQNRILDQQMRQREDDRTFRRESLDEQGKLRQQTIDEQKRHNQVVEGGETELWHAQGDASMGYRGPVAGVKAWKDLATQMQDPNLPPGKFTGSKPEKTPSVLDIGKFIKLGFTSPEKMLEWRDKNADWINKVQEEEQKLYGEGTSGSAPVATAREVIKLRTRAKELEQSNPETSKGLSEMADRLEKGMVKPDRPFTRRVTNPNNPDDVVTQRMSQEEYEASMKKADVGSSGSSKRLVYDVKTGRLVPAK